MEIRFGGKYALIVAGGGMAGVSCAIAAARKGVRCLLIEKEGCLGGTACQSGVMHLLGGRWYNPEADRMERVVGGLFDEITDELIRSGEAVEPDSVDVHRYNPYGWYPRMAAGVPCDVDALKLLLERKCLEAGVTLRYYTEIVDVERENERIRRVLVHEKAGFFAFEAALFADCTGDADVAALCGCPTEKGRAEDGAMCPASMIFYVDHVDAQRYVAYQNEHQSPKLVEIISDLRQKGEWPYDYEIFIAIETPEEGRFMVNTIRQTGVDGTDAESMTKAALEGRAMAFDLTRIMRKYFPGFEQARICRTFDRVGIRETRRILAREMITLESALAGRHYETCVASTTYNFDLPDPKRPSFDPMMGDAKKPNALRKHVKIEIPYGALLPRDVDNLIVAGRCLGAEREVMGACRVMGPCMGMGQAAGYAAALAQETGDFSAVCVKSLRNMLLEDGCIGL